MQKIFQIITLLFLFLTFVDSKCQNYTPLLNQTNEWQVTSCYNGDCITDIYYTNGDTIVNNQTFKVLDGYHYINRNFLIREDIEEKKVFMNIILPNRIDEFLMYDFGMEINDTINLQNPFTPFVNNAGFYRLNNIENVMQNNQEYRFFHLSPTENNEISSNNIIWIEGMGSLSIINAPSGAANIDEVGIVTCFFKNGDLFYHDANGWGDNCAATLEIQPNEEKKLAVYFPENRKVVLENAQHIHEIAWYDVSGKLISNENISSQNTYIWELNHLKSGFYILKCISDLGHQQNFKVIIK
jgi:hypothetical protein